MGRRLSAGLLALLVTGACADDRCKKEPPQFQLDILAPPGMGARSLEVSVGLAGTERFETFNLQDKLEDGETSLAVLLQPELSEAFDLDVAVTAYDATDGNGAVLAVASDSFSGSPDACNLFSITLDQNAPDGGVPDAGDICNPSCGPAGCNFDCPCATCYFDCAAGDPCNFMCGGQEICTAACPGADGCAGNCSGNASCEIACGDADECSMSCSGNAECLLRCQNAGTCTLDGCANQVQCPDGSIACGRACP